ncbi:MAG: 50S ribosomal protein L10 [Candidatus Saganbacteria bacterium]|nr:50S ribosomal protein L10 [Candidatus Saganbacteria bacterium]
MANTKVIEKKKRVVDQLKEKIESASVLIVSNYRGITVKEITSLRRKLYAQDSEYKIIKNTLLKKALEASGLSELTEHLSGPTGLLLGYKDPVAPLKSLVEFIDEIEKGEVKIGVVEKTVVDNKSIADLAELPSREVLLAKIVGGLSSPLYGLVNVLQGNIRNLVYALSAVKDKKDKDKVLEIGGEKNGKG